MLIRAAPLNPQRPRETGGVRVGQPPTTFERSFTWSFLQMRACESLKLMTDEYSSGPARSVLYNSSLAYLDLLCCEMAHCDAQGLSIMEL
jgi:hypothetical protein